MHRRLWLSVAMLVARGKPSGRTGFASASRQGRTRSRRAASGGTASTGHRLQVDPQLAYVTTAWWLEYATAAKLYNYPDKPGPAGSKLVPEVASKFTVSKNGKMYTFLVRTGFKFSNGTPVTAANFKYAINRDANHDLASPGAPFITDPNGTNIVGAKAVNDGTGTNVSRRHGQGQQADDPPDQA